ncbi:MAG: hypothetical protein JXB04_05995 [Kiritimatiellae bacterium]|nr:hypothetical protein [Kiritimatiellia bacterium]
MRLLIAGKDESEGLGRELSAAAEARAKQGSPRFLSPQHSALSLRECADTREYQDRFVTLLGMRHGVDPEVEVLVRPGLLGKFTAAVKGVVWKLIRYRMEKLVERQNVVNEMTAHAVEFQNEILREEIAELKEKLAQHGGPGA